MAQATEGDAVKVHYTGRLDDGTVFDSSDGRDPLAFTLGEGQIIPGFEQGVAGMAVGSKKTVNIPAEKAYGPRDPERELKVPRGEFPGDIDPEIGQKLQVGPPDGVPAIVTVIGITDEEITLDANHPLAGQALTFDLELVQIN
jgi:peptidylprolyl isomerase